MVPFTNKVEIRIREKVRIKRLIFIDSHQTAPQKCQVDSEYMSLEIKTEPGLEKHSEKAIGDTVGDTVGKTWFQIPTNTFTSNVTLD